MFMKFIHLFEFKFIFLFNKNSNDDIQILQKIV